MTLFRCTACGHTLFPARLLCPRCGGAAWERVACGSGRVEAVTNLPGGTLAAVRVVNDIVVLARMDSATSGDTLILDERSDGAVIARPMEDSDA